MLLNFKNINDILSLDDFNALVYILKQKYKPVETINLDYNDIIGEFGTYSLISSSEKLPMKNEGFVVTNYTDSLILNINSPFSGLYKIRLKILKNIGTVEEDSDILNIEKEYYKEFLSTNLGNMQQITIPLNEFKKDEIICTDAEISIIYDIHEFDKITGDLNLDVNNTLISTTEALISAITNATNNSTTILYLEPNKIFKLTEQIVIANKTIDIRSGSTHAIIDADSKSRHFKISPNGELKLTNIDLTNGKDAGGGSILIESSIDSNDIEYKGKLSSEQCNFINNKSTTQGGAILSNNAICYLSNCIFNNNTSKSDNNVYGNGGAIFNKWDGA